jgi:hypothetical protein
LLEHIVGMPQIAEPGCRLKRIQTHIGLQHPDGPQGLARICQNEAKAEIRKIRIDRDSAFKFGDRLLMPTLEDQYPPQLSMSLRQMGVELHCLLRQGIGSIQPSGAQIVMIAWFKISVNVSPREHGGCPCILRID